MYSSPLWFAGMDLILESAYVLIALLIAIFAVRMYRKTHDQRIVLFSTGFISIAISYVILLLTNMCSMMNVSNYFSITPYQLFFGGFFLHVFFMITGLTTLIFATYCQSKKALWFVLPLITLIGIYWSQLPEHIFYIFSVILLVVLASHFLSTYLKNNNKKTLLVAIAFILMIISRLQFLAALELDVYYALGHIFELIAYGFILGNYVLVYRNGKKATSNRNRSRHSRDDKK